MIEQSKKSENSFDFFKQYLKQIAWSRRTFGPGYDVAGLFDHMIEEMQEIQKAPEDLEEWIDLVILAIDGAWRCAHQSYPKATNQELASKVMSMYKHKCKKNESRNWPDWRQMPPGKAIKHIKEK